ncbi:MAG: DnaJ domain-containing protein [Bacilli bacterium]|nr:DnaJ domain-containing protein [Bacilli bacterium]
MENRKDYYKILGITDEEKNLKGDDFEKIIKSKFRKLSLKYHPDKNQGKTDEEKKVAEEQFKEISEAYSVLSDPKKREEYDNPMSNFQFGGFGGSGFEDLFNHFNPFGSRMDFGGGRANRVVKGSSIRIFVDLTLEEMYNGIKKTIKYKRNDSCSHCKGTGRTASSKEEMCSQCGGTGQLFTQRGGWQQIVTCPHCKGKGKVLINPCTHCGGNGLEVKEHQVELNIPKGVFGGLQFSVNHEGCAPEGGNGVYGDLIVVIREIQHEKFTREQLDLYVNLEVPIIDAILGCTKSIETIDGKTLSTKIPQGVEDGTKIRFVGKGMPNYDNNRQVGNMYAIIKLKLPKSLNDTETKLLNELKEQENFK